MAKGHRVVVDCRLYPSEKNCTPTIAGAEDEVLEMAVHHAVTLHGHKNDPQLRETIRSLLKEERA